ncbi:P-loop NTPase fold protein [Xenorhabdus ishibashii]|uniref:KAP NTPase domain-containing protein n=1 Tax=Xenorhabdus ishibashii TaxID=1034471 RepID=A0A2D0KCG2_9GAMM|nr:P-loop NTPase fold protein [Xenorhabdus ishibashii]PHM61149.1 hypothetical protein Xish_00270 [Xenorhabdus ishibashii]
MRVLPKEQDFSEGFTEDNDLFKRKVLHKQILDIVLNSFDDSLVLALDDKWGNGKTSFVKMMQGEINKDREINVIYFDSYKNDYQSNALVALLSCVYNMIDKEQYNNSDIKIKFLNASKKILVSIVKNSPKALVRILTSNLINETVIESAGDSITNAIADPLDKSL